MNDFTYSYNRSGLFMGICSDSPELMAMRVFVCKDGQPEYGE